MYRILARILFLQIFEKIHTEWALAYVTESETQRKQTPRRVFLKTVEILVSPEVLCTAEILKATFCTFEVLWALHFSYDLFNLLPVLVFHRFLLLAQQWNKTMLHTNPFQFGLYQFCGSQDKSASPLLATHSKQLAIQ